MPTPVETAAARRGDTTRACPDTAARPRGLDSAQERLLGEALDALSNAFAHEPTEIQLLETVQSVMTGDPAVDHEIHSMARLYLMLNDNESRSVD